MKNRFSFVLAFCLIALFSLNSKAQSSDFLNSYFENQTPLNNNTFSFSLVGFIIGDKKVGGGNDYSSKKDGPVVNIPELLDANDLSIYGVSPNLILNSTTKFNQLLVNQNLGWFNSNMPKLEILKNKLVTFNYSDGNNESFLFNVKKLNASEENNNFRKALQLEFTTEDVKKDDDENNDRTGNVVWRIFAIGDESYLALAGNQLNRIHVDLFSAYKEGNDDDYYQSDGRLGVQVSSGSNVRMLTQNQLNQAPGYRTTGKGIYLARKQDKFMDSGYYLNPSELVFLFKLSQ
jgi:hypothetical protein